MRLFIAVYPSAAALESLRAAVVAASVEPTSWRPLPFDHWHLTLAFLGEVAENRVCELTERLGRAAGRNGPVTLALAGAGAFPSARRARVLWAGLDGDRDGLTRLAERATAAARRSGIATEELRYRPHLTVARARAPRGTDATEAVTALQDYAGRPEPVVEIVLVRSHLGSAVRHERLAGWPLLN